jgi:hypothetical protein
MHRYAHQHPQLPGFREYHIPYISYITTPNKSFLEGAVIKLLKMVDIYIFFLVYNSVKQYKLILFLLFGGYRGV